MKRREVEGRKMTRQHPVLKGPRVSCTQPHGKLTFIKCYCFPKDNSKKKCRHTTSWKLTFIKCYCFKTRVEERLPEQLPKKLYSQELLWELAKIRKIEFQRNLAKEVIINSLARPLKSLKRFIGFNMTERNTSNMLVLKCKNIHFLTSLL